VLELPNKFTLDGPLWLAVQQHLYRGWGPFIGPFEVTAIISAWLLCYLARNDRPIFGLTLLASCLLSVALLVYFLLNAPVNAAFASWTPLSLPVDWPKYRWRWEVGHATSFILVLMAFVALLRGLFWDTLSRAKPSGTGAGARA
jgi:hypothetical protein